MVKADVRINGILMAMNMDDLRKYSPQSESQAENKERYIVTRSGERVPYESIDLQKAGMN